MIYLAFLGKQYIDKRFLLRRELDGSLQGRVSVILFSQLDLHNASASPIGTVSSSNPSNFSCQEVCGGQYSLCQFWKKNTSQEKVFCETCKMNDRRLTNIVFVTTFSPH